MGRVSEGRRILLDRAAGQGGRTEQGADGAQKYRPRSSPGTRARTHTHTVPDVTGTHTPYAQRAGERGAASRAELWRRAARPMTADSPLPIIGPPAPEPCRSRTSPIILSAMAPLRADAHSARRPPSGGWPGPGPQARTPVPCPPPSSSSPPSQALPRPSRSPWFVRPPPPSLTSRRFVDRKEGGGWVSSLAGPA